MPRKNLKFRAVRDLVLLLSIATTLFSCTARHKQRIEFSSTGYKYMESGYRGAILVPEGFSGGTIDRLILFYKGIRTDLSVVTDTVKPVFESFVSSKRVLLVIVDHNDNFKDIRWIDDVAADTVTVLNKPPCRLGVTGIRSITLIGHSFGGYVAMRGYAQSREYLQWIDSIIFLDGIITYYDDIAHFDGFKTQLISSIEAGRIGFMRIAYTGGSTTDLNRAELGGLAAELARLKSAGKLDYEALNTAEHERALEMLGPSIFSQLKSYHNKKYSR